MKTNRITPNHRMTRGALRVSTVLTFATMLTLAGCAADGDAGSDDTSELSYAGFNLESDDGGFDEAADYAAFDDAIESMAADAFDEDGEAIAEPEVDDAMTSLGDVDRYEIRLVWGQRTLADDVPPTQWDGAVSTDRGGLRLLRTIRFEGNDQVLPRTSHQSIEFESTTTVHNDGLRLRLAVPRTEAAATGALTISLGDLAPMTIPHQKLRHLAMARTVDDLGNGVSLVAFAHGACPQGMVSGHWRRLNAHGGVMAGRVALADGDGIGRLRGIWGVRKDGTRRFFGILTRAGQKAGVVRGTWRPFPEREGGVFRGHWVTGGEHQGVLTGTWRAAPEGGRGRFHGVFAEKCNADFVVAAPDEAPADLCSADGICVAEPAVDCTDDACTDATDL